MKFSCNPCSYTTARKTDLTRHIMTRKHLDKVKQKTTKSKKSSKSTAEISTEFKCAYCESTYSTPSNRSKHMKKCIQNPHNTIVIDMANALKEKDNEVKNIIKEKDNELKEKDHEIKLIINEKDIQLKEIVIDNLKKEIELLNKQLETKDKQLEMKDVKLDKQTDMVSELLKAAYSSSKSPANINNITYITNNYPNAPALAQLPSYDYIRESTSLSLIEALYLNNEKGNLCQFISKFIIDAYAKKNACDQSMWSCDTSRFTYIINELQESGKLKWITDKHGIRLKKYVVDPLLQYFQDDLDTYINKYSYQSDLHIVYRLKFVADMYDLIKTGVLASDIIKYIAPYFSLIKNDESEIKQIEGSKVEEQKTESVMKQIKAPKAEQKTASKPKQKTVPKKELITKKVSAKKSNQDSDQDINNDSMEEFMKDLREIKALQKTQKAECSEESGKHIEEQIKNIKAKATKTTNNNISID